MKKQIILSMIFVLTFIFSSCDDFLTEELKGEYSTKTLYTTQESALMALTGVYNGTNFTSSNNLIWVFGDVASDDAVKGGNPGDQADIGLIDAFNISSDNGVLLNYWTFCYELVARTNNVIAYVPGINMDPGLRNRIVAEAKFFRALVYFNLTNIWGKVPLKLEPQTTPDKVYVPFSEVSAIYSQIEKDLTDAAGILPAYYSGSSDQGRVTKGAAYGLLAKAQLYQKKWSDCLNTITNIESLKAQDGSALYELTANYEDLFKSGAETNKEVMFTVNHLSEQVPVIGNSLNQWFAPSVENGYYFNAPTQNYVDAFDEKTTTGVDDPRLDASIGRDGKPWLNGDVFSSSWSTATGYLVKKHDQPLSEVPKGTKGDGNLSYIYLRYADILLMKAEALNEDGKTDAINNAAAAINEVRFRAGLGPVNATTTTSMRSAIQKERRRELGFEFHRFFDLMRWGKDVATAALGPDFKWTEPRYYFPVPQAELDANIALK